MVILMYLNLMFFKNSLSWAVAFSQMDKIGPFDVCLLIYYFEEDMYESIIIFVTRLTRA